MNNKPTTLGTSDFTMNQTTQPERRKGIMGGIFFILLGGLFLLTQFFTFDIVGWLFLPLLATVFIAWGALVRNAGLFVPAGILSGLGLGAGLMEFTAVGQSDQQGAGIFLLGFAAGWLLIILLSAVFTAKTHWWPLIPASIMSLVGIAAITDGILLDVLSVLGRGWPLILIAAGLYVTYRKF